MTVIPAETGGGSISIQIPWREVALWGVFVTALAVVLLYLVGTEQGALSLISGEGVHEFVHDARHLLGFPCH